MAVSKQSLTSRTRVKFRPSSRKSTEDSYTGVLISPYPDQEGNKLQRPNSNFCKPLKKKFRKLSVQPGHRGNNDLRVGRKMVTFQLFFQSGRAKDLSAPLTSFHCSIKSVSLTPCREKSSKKLTSKLHLIPTVYVAS